MAQQGPRDVSKSTPKFPKYVQLVCCSVLFGSRLRMERVLRLGTDRGSKEYHKQGPTQREARGRQVALWRVGLALVTSPPVPEERPGTDQTMGTVGAYSTLPYIIICFFYSIETLSALTFM